LVNKINKKKKPDGEKSAPHNITRNRPIGSGVILLAASEIRFKNQNTEPEVE